MNIHRPGELSMTSHAETSRSAEIKRDFLQSQTGYIETAVFVLCRFFMAHSPPYLKCVSVLVLKQISGRGERALKSKTIIVFEIVSVEQGTLK